MFNFVKIAIKNLARNRRRNIITIIAILFGVALIIVAWGLINGSLDAMVQSAISTDSGHLKILPPGTTGVLHTIGSGTFVLSIKSIENTDKMMQILDKNKLIDAASPRLKTQSVISNADETKSSIVTVIGVNPEREKKATIVAKQTKEGSYLKKNDYSVVLGHDLAKDLGVKVGDKINLTTLSGKQQFNVKGIYRTGYTLNRSFIYIPLEISQKINNFDNKVSEILITLKDRNKINEAKAEIQKEFKNNNLEANIQTWKDMVKELEDVINMAVKIYSIVFIIILSIVGLGIANTMFMNIAERTREIGILKALGSKNRELLQMFLCEAISLGVIGGISGSVLGSLVVFYLSKTGIDISAKAQYAGISVIYPQLGINGILIALGIALVISIIFAIYPAWKASRMEPAEALRYE